MLYNICINDNPVLTLIYLVKVKLVADAFEFGKLLASPLMGKVAGKILNFDKNN